MCTHWCRLRVRLCFPTLMAKWGVSNNLRYAVETLSQSRKTIFEKCCTNPMPATWADFQKYLHIYVYMGVRIFDSVWRSVSGCCGRGWWRKSGGRGIVQRVYTVRLFNLNCFAGAVASCNDETKANNCNNFAQCASVSVCPAPSLHPTFAPLEHLSSSQTLA